MFRIRIQFILWLLGALGATAGWYSVGATEACSGDAIRWRCHAWAEARVSAMAGSVGEAPRIAKVEHRSASSKAGKSRNHSSHQMSMSQYATKAARAVSQLRVRFSSLYRTAAVLSTYIVVPPVPRIIAAPPDEIVIPESPASAVANPRAPPYRERTELATGVRGSASWLFPQ